MRSAFLLRLLLAITLTVIAGCSRGKKGPLAPLPPLVAHDCVTPEEVSTFFARYPNKIHILVMFRSSSDPTYREIEQAACRRIETMAAKVSDVAVLARIDMTGTAGDGAVVQPGKPQVTFKLKGTPLNPENQAMREEDIEDLLNTTAEDIRHPKPPAPPKKTPKSDSSNQPPVAPMKKDWLPPGVERR